jgi:molecular chaperone DnaJ
VAPDADAATIRAAYRRLAREHHPDQRGGAADASEMATINEAYRVLADPGRRAQYDRATNGSAGVAGSGTADREWTAPPTGGSPPRYEVDPTPVRMPWRLMGGIAAFGTAAVLLGAIFTDPPAERPPDGLLRSGSCVAIEVNGDAREVRCEGAGDLAVRQLVPLDARCPVGTEPHRDRQGLGTACIVVADG